jgi:hypothetical protein
MGYAPPAKRTNPAMVVIVILAVLVIIGVVVGLALSGGLSFGATGACVGVDWNGSYYDYTRVYGYTEAECDAWCASHSFGTNCYWEP